MATTEPVEHKTGSVLKNTNDQPNGWSKVHIFFKKVAEPTGLEPATSDVTGRRSNQLNYDSAKTKAW